MCGRAVAVCVAIFAANIATIIAQDGYINVEVSDPEHNEHYDHEDIEKPMTSELVRDMITAKSEALLLYTEFTSKAGMDLKIFLKNISIYADEALRAVEKRPYFNANGHCRRAFETRLKKIHLDAYKAASFSGENHHKFMLGHMVVFRMHLNKTEEYIKKCEKALHGCGSRCENKPKVRRWKRLALEEIHRVKDDLQHSRKSYKDLVSHAKRRLIHLRKQIDINTADAAEDYHKCLNGN